MLKIGISLLFVVFHFVQIGYGQCIYLPQKQSKISPVVGIGSTRFYGDIANQHSVFNNDLAFSAGLQYRLLGRLSLRSELVYYRISASDEFATRESGRLARNLSFRGDNLELNGVAMLDLFPTKKFSARPLINPYVFAGIGITYYQPKAYYQGRWYSLRPLRTEGVAYGMITPVIPLGAGVRIKVRRNANLLLEGGYRVTFSDYLDDVSTVYPHFSSFNSPLAAALSDRAAEAGYRPKPTGAKRGNPEIDDAYFIGSVKMEFLLTSSAKTKFNNKKRRK